MEEQSNDELKDPNVRKTFDFEMSLLEPLWEISRKGMKVSKQQMEIIRLACEDAIQKKGMELEQIAGFPVNVMSGPQVKKVLCDQLGMPVVKLTPKRAASNELNIESDMVARIEEPIPYLRPFVTLWVDNELFL